MKAAVDARVERFGCRATESFEFFRSEFSQHSVRIQEFFFDFLRNSETMINSQHLPLYSAKIRENFMRIGAKFDKDDSNIMTFCRNSNNNTKTLDDL